MRQIAQEVGVGVGALYLYTPDKQSLLADLMIEHLEELLSAWGEQPDEIDNPIASLERFVRFHIRFHLDRVDRVFISYMELRNLTDENFLRVERLRRLYEQVVEDILQDGVVAGVFRVSDPRVASLALIAMLAGITTWFRAGGRLPPDRIEDIYCELAFGAVGAAEATAQGDAVSETA